MGATDGSGTQTELSPVEYYVSPLWETKIVLYQSIMNKDDELGAYFILRLEKRQGHIKTPTNNSRQWFLNILLIQMDISARF